jgi:hypothetical protein
MRLMTMTAPTSRTRGVLRVEMVGPHGVYIDKGKVGSVARENLGPRLPGCGEAVSPGVVTPQGRARFRAQNEKPVRMVRLAHLRSTLPEHSLRCSRWDSPLNGFPERLLGDPW